MHIRVGSIVSLAEDPREGIYNIMVVCAYSRYSAFTTQRAFELIKEQKAEGEQKESIVNCKKLVQEFTEEYPKTKNAWCIKDDDNDDATAATQQRKPLYNNMHGEGFKTLEPVSKQILRESIPMSRFAWSSV